MGRVKDLTGQSFGKLTVLSEAGRNKHNMVTWLCQCDCGKEKIINGNSLKQGKSKTCGCSNKEQIRSLNRKHGNYNHPLYKVWRGLRQRCNCTSHTSYKNYGGRGIKVCERWNNFSNFLEDMQGDYKPGLQIDRIDNDGDYSPENCRWVTHKENQRNRSSNMIISTPKGEMCLSEASEAFDINENTLWHRVNRLGWSGEDSVTAPLMRKLK